MKKDICFILLFLFVTASSAFAQLIGFESSEVPEAFKTSGKGEAKISSLFYKEGKSSLEWDFQSFIIKRKNGETVWHYLVDI